MALIFCSLGTRLITDTAVIAYIDSNRFSIVLPIGSNWTTSGLFYLSPGFDSWKRSILLQACTNSPLAPSTYAELEIDAQISPTDARRLIINHGGALDAYALYWVGPTAVRPNISLQPGTVYSSTTGATFFKYDIWENNAPAPCCGTGPPPPDPVDPPCGKLTKTLCYDIQEDCCNSQSYDNPVYLGWYNSLGGWETWLFDCIYREEVVTETVDKFTSYFNDIAMQNKRSLQTRKKATEKLMLETAYVDRSEREALKEIYFAPLVYIWQGLDSVGNDKWLVVHVEDGNIPTYNTAITKQQFELSILLPELFTISN